MKYNFFLKLVFFVFIFSNLFAEEKGTISGKIIDAKTKETLPSVNVKVKGTYYGAVTNLDGIFKIQNINIGTYTIEITLIGYKTFQLTGIKVVANEVKNLEIKLEETSLTLEQDVVIIGEKPLFNIEETTTRRITTNEEIKIAAVQKVQDVVAMQVGVTQSENEIHIRGGRGYENAYLINGISVQDGLAGSGFGLQLSPDAIEEIEVLTGGYNAEFGQATSGIVNVRTREGKNNFDGSINIKSDNFFFNKNLTSFFNSKILSATLSGPTPIDGLTFFSNLDLNFADGYARWLEKIVNGIPNGYYESIPTKLNSTILDFSFPNRENKISWLGKFTYKLTPTEKFTFSTSQSILVNQDTKTVQATLERSDPNPGFQYKFANIPDSAATFTSINNFNSISFVQTLNTKTFYEIQFSMFTAHVRGDNNGSDKNKDGKIDWNDYSEPLDIVTFPIDTFRVSPETLRVIPGDGFYDVGSPNVWRDHYLEEYTLKFDFNHHFSESNKFKTGIETKFQNIQYVDINEPWIKPLGIDNDKYKVSPAMGSMYAQNTVAIQGMILNFGLRLDYWFPGKYVDDAVKNDSTLVADIFKSQYKNETFDFLGRKLKMRLSPRLGISHPISDNQTLFFSYGHFSKLPRPQFIYSKLNSTSAKSSSQIIGNPNLNPETTVAYELGIRNQLSDNDVFSLSAYYKDIFDYITSIDIPIRTPRAKGTYKTYINQDYARTRGIEIEYKKRIGKYFKGTFSASYSIATGKSSTATESLLGTSEGRRETITENYLNWDKPIQITTYLNFSIPKGKPIFFLEDINFFSKIFFQSGKRYSPWVFAGVDSVNYQIPRTIYRDEPKNYNKKNAESWFYVDVNLEKYFDLFLGTLVLNFEIQNLFANKNSQIINPITGCAYEYGDDVPYDVWNDPRYPDLIQPISIYPYNPARYLNPRTFKIGLSYKF